MFYNNLCFFQSPLQLLAKSPLYFLLGLLYIKDRPELTSISTEGSWDTIKLLESCRRWLRRFPWLNTGAQRACGGDRR